MEDSSIVKIAAFDFDGTIIDGQSGAELVRYMMGTKMIPLSTILRVGWWGIRYKLKLPVRQCEVREAIFNLFVDESVEWVDTFLAQFFEDRLKHLVRKDAVEQINKSKQEGKQVVVVSASFDAILRPAKKMLNIDKVLATHMELNSNKQNYNGKVLGKTVEGSEKIHQVRKWANEEFGHHNWVIDEAFGDHYTDIPLLASANKPYAVDPDSRLEKHAKRRGWLICEWS